MHKGAVTQGTVQLGGTHQKPEARQAEAASPGDRLKRQPVLWMAMDLRGRCLMDMLVHYLSIWSPGIPSPKDIVIQGFVYKPVWALVRAGWVEFWHGKSIGNDLKWRRKKGTPGSGYLFCSVSERYCVMEQLMESHLGVLPLQHLECKYMLRGKQMCEKE